MPIAIDIDVTLLDKARFKRITRKSGQPAVFANLVLFDKPDAHGNDGFVKQSQTKEERDRGDSQLPILGNWKHLGEKRQAPAPAPKPPAAPQPDMAEDDIPF
jgi:hypothetical protein